MNSRSLLALSFPKGIAQNAYCFRDIFLQFTKYLRSVILSIIIIINARRRASFVKTETGAFSCREYHLAHQLEEGEA